MHFNEFKFGTCTIDQNSLHLLDLMNLRLLVFLQGYKNNSYTLQSMEINNEKYASVQTVTPTKIWYVQHKSPLLVL